MTFLETQELLNEIRSELRRGRDTSAYFHRAERTPDRITKERLRLRQASDEFWAASYHKEHVTGRLRTWWATRRYERASRAVGR